MSAQADAAVSGRSLEGLLALGRERFGIRAFRPGQAEAIGSVLDGRDTLAIMPTGAGKSLCYQLPALVLDGITLVVSPLIALMKDQHDKLAELGIDVLRLDSTLTQREDGAALERLGAGGPCVAYVTPERLGDARFRDRLRSVRVALFVVDEAHCISQWGHDFRPAYLGLGEAAAALGRPPILALTATAPARVKDDILAQLRMESAAVVDLGLSRPNLRYHVLRARSERRKQAMLLRLLERKAGCGIIYAATVKTVDELADFLREQGVEAGRYHGRMRPRERAEVQTAFMERGQPRVMVATNAFGLGVDKQDLRFVIHYNFPGSLESYYQEAGRAGRDGLPADCVLLYQPADKRIQSFFLGGRYPTPEQTQAVAEALWALARGRGRGRSAAPSCKEVAERADTPVKKTRVVLSYFEDAGFAEEIEGARFAPLTEAPPSLAELLRAAERYEQKRASDQARLQAMLRYAESHLCRNRLLHAYFGYGDDAGASCGSCDNCRRAARASEARASEAAAELASRRAAAASPGASRRARASRPRALKVARQRGRAPGAFDKGDVVRHATWGEGEVVGISADTVCAFFPGFGEKRLKARFLEKA